MANIIKTAERIIYLAKLRYLEELAIANAAQQEGLTRAPLAPPSQVLQTVVYNGEHLGRVRHSQDGWYATLKDGGRSHGPYPDADTAAEALFALRLMTHPNRQKGDT
ncbi:hypothetical protein AB0F24_38545 [Streptomyces platensis]|uniref:hypothetical protein n=1 Tax=Streptomyces platensis TaxID=58346 RepID=UPI00340A505C